MGCLFVVIGYWGRRWRGLRVSFGILTALFGAALGLLGSALVVFWASKHWAAHANYSLLACPPWALGLVVLGVGFALDRPRSVRSLRLLLAVSLASTALLGALTLAGLARETKRIRLGTLVSPATFRLPGVLAIEVAQVDAMSGGRAELGLGAGWFEAEHAAYGMPFPPSAERLD